MARRTAEPRRLGACYALTVPGLEHVAAQEIEETLSAEIKRVAAGLIVFRPPEISRDLLSLRTVEDVFLLLWGTDRLTYRAEDLDLIRRWTAREPDWPEALRLLQKIRPRPKGRPTVHLVTQMRGEHGYRRADAAKAFAKGLAGKLPETWWLVDENADYEIWLTIDGSSAVCGLRLSDRTMRHREYKQEHLPASLRPVVAAAMVRLARIPYHGSLLDPMCGTGTILAERLSVQPRAFVLGGDLDYTALLAALANLKHVGKAFLARWDARRLPIRDACIDRIACNPPFGIQLGDPFEIADLYRSIVREMDRVLVPDGKAVLLVSDVSALEAAAKLVRWKRQDRLRIRLLGQPSYITVWSKA
ncbi:MAG: RNA methyltransferase [Gemmatales bacterium]|nr:RNA methyltransferase [Gemmatales bacterium]MDW8387942.1 methyltransferase [Gemmatales bacterium]